MNVVTLQAALALGRAGHRVDLVTRRDDPSLPDVVELTDGVRVVNLAAGPATPVAKSAQDALIEPFSEAFGRWLDAVPLPDLVHSHHWFSGVAAIPQANRRGIPHLQSFHSVAAPVGAELAAGEQPESSGRPVGERLAARESQRIIAVSRYEASVIHERYGVDPGPMTVVHPGVDTELFAPGPQADPPYVVFAARLQPLKAPDLAIRALAHLPARVRLVVTGEPSADFADYASELHELVHGLGLSDRVEFLSSVDRRELAKLFAGAVALVNPSHSETFGLVNLEAQACGVPVVATRTGGVPESLIDGRTGVLMDSRDPAEWARVLAGFVEDPERRTGFGGAGRAFALGRSWDAVAAELVDVYRGELR